MALLLRFRMPDGTISDEEYLSEDFYRRLVRRGWHAGGQGNFEDETEEFNVTLMEDQSFEDGEFHEIILEKPTLN
jgi:hypothetical protein